LAASALAPACGTPPAGDDETKPTKPPDPDPPPRGQGEV